MSATSGQTIYVTSRFGRNEKLMYALPLKCEPMFWDSARCRVKPTRYCPYRDEVNSALDELDKVFLSYSCDVVASGGEITKESLIELLDVHFGKVRENNGDFHAFFEDYIEACKTRMNHQRGGQLVTYKTRREYATTFEYIKQYESRKGICLGFEDINQDYLTEFVGFLQKLNKATNTIAHKVICVKAVMRAAVERGLTNNERWKYYRNSTEQTDSVALNEEELERIRRCDLHNHKSLERVRDLFLMCCWTGLRFSDISSLTKECIQGDMIVLRQRKTNNYVTIPIHPVFREVWERYGGIPASMSNQKFNLYIKDVCKAARLRERVLKSITKGGKKVTTSYEKWQLVTSHTGRRSFATNLYRSGFPSISIMRITGHKTETAFLKYIKVDMDEHARLLAEHWNKHEKEEGHDSKH